MKNRHNTLDYECTRWVGDMRPKKDDRQNTELFGDHTRVQDRRCVVCNPYGDDEASTLLDVDLFMPQVLKEPL